MIQAEGRGIECTALSAAAAGEVAAMTFPAYRHLLALVPAARHPGEPDAKPVQPFGLVAREDGRTVGLALAELPLVPEGTPELLSLFVVPAARRRGVATALLERLERELAGRGFAAVQAVYMTGKSATAAVEGLLARCGWPPSEPRTVSVRFTLEEAQRTPWFGRVRLPPEDEILAWRDVAPEERRALRRSQEESGWIAPDLVPWRFDEHGFEPRSSLGLRHRGALVGWTINHAIAPDTVRFTCSFMRRDLARRGRILPLYTASILALRDTPYRLHLFVAPMHHPAMVGFVRRWCAPWVSYCGETRGAVKRLMATPPGVGRAAGAGGGPGLP